MDKERQERIITKQGWIAVDLDGTLATYDGWKGIKHIGEPIPKMVEKIKEHIKDGFDVRIYTARVCQGQDGLSVEQIIKIIQKWGIRHIGHCLAVTNVKDFGMITCYDDRATQVFCNIGITAEDKIKSLEAENAKFKAENKGLRETIDEAVRNCIYNCPCKSKEALKGLEVG